MTVYIHHIEIDIFCTVVTLFKVAFERLVRLGISRVKKCTGNSMQVLTQSKIWYVINKEAQIAAT